MQRGGEQPFLLLSPGTVTQYNWEAEVSHSEWTVWGGFVLFFVCLFFFLFFFILVSQLMLWGVKKKFSLSFCCEHLNWTPPLRFQRSFFSFVTFHCSLPFHFWMVKRPSRLVLFSRCVCRVQHHTGNARALEVEFQPQTLRRGPNTFIHSKFQLHF